MNGLRRVMTLAALLFASAASPHAMNSAHWRVVQLDQQHWESRLRLPEDAAGRLLSLTPLWPEGCVQVQPESAQPVDEGSLLQWRMRCPKGLSGSLRLSGFNLSLPDAVLELRPLHGSPRHVVLSRQQPGWTLGAPEVPPPASHYLGLGVHHLLLGPDHLLFILGLWALWRRSGARLAPLVGTVTAFTVAHSITLAAAAIGRWSLPPAAVEACIAASLLLLAVELATGHRGWITRMPATAAFAFGLLHGFGFAGALAETGLPEDARLLALFAFNLGIELGQLILMAVLLLLAQALRPLARWAPVALAVYGGVAAYWTLTRSIAVLTL